jgi:N-acetylmuramoyl-L-alanine amidase
VGNEAISRRGLLARGLATALLVCGGKVETAEARERRTVRRSTPPKPLHERTRPASRASRRQRTAPKPLIVIDPGHGGRDPGAVGVLGTLEKTIALTVARELRRALLATGRYRVVLTREGDVSLTLQARLAFARRSRAALLVSLHADSAPGARGASAYTLSTSPLRPAASASVGSSARLAQLAVAEVGRVAPLVGHLPRAVPFLRTSTT